jgi:hypothetical protein
VRRPPLGRDLTHPLRAGLIRAHVDHADQERGRNAGRQQTARLSSVEKLVTDVPHLDLGDEFNGTGRLVDDDVDLARRSIPSRDGDGLF